MITFSRRISRAALLAFTISGIACGSSQETAPELDSLSGAWSARFEMESSEGLPQSPTARVVEGQLIMDAASPGAAEPPPTPRPVTRGRIVADFSPLGFSMTSTSAIGWYSAAPTLSIILNPDVDHGNIAITGIQAGDTIDGQWQLLDNPTRASGKVRLTRERRN